MQIELHDSSSPYFFGDYYVTRDYMNWLQVDKIASHVPLGPETSDRTTAVYLYLLHMWCISHVPAVNLIMGSAPTYIK